MFESTYLSKPIDYRPDSVIEVAAELAPKRCRAAHMINETECTHNFGRRRRLTAALAGTAALAVATLGFTSAAGAAGIGTAEGTAATAPSLVKPPTGFHSTGTRFGAGASQNVAGYDVTPSGGLASASVTFTVPAITCSASDKTEGAEMFDGVYTFTLKTYALATSYCTSKGPAADLDYATPYGEYTLGAAAGDTVVTSMNQSATATWAEVHDLTSGAYGFSEIYSNVGDTEIELGSLTYASEGSPVPTFTKIPFSVATVNGDDLGFSSVGASRYNALNGGDLVIKTSALTTTGAGTTFSLKFERAS
jgi:hypothetical protein